VGWGDNAYGKCNIPSPNSGFIAIAAGEVHSLAIKKVGQDKLTGGLNDDCRVGWEDVRIFTGQWLDSDSGEQLRIASAGQDANSPGVFPNDEYFPNQWHLHNTGQSGGTPGADIRAPEAWEITTGDPNIVVAVIDIGVDSKHPDLIGSLVPGYDFWDLDDLPDPANGPEEAHGTMCAGLIAAQGNNGIGVVGVAYNCKIMPIRHGAYMGGQISGEEEVTAFRWAAANGADVISCSWGVVNPITHSGVKDVTKLGGIGREGKGCVVVFAAGNQLGRIPSTSSPAYPEVIAVGATDHNDVRYDYSDYGPELDLVAPSGCDGTFVGCSPMVTLWSTDQPGEGGWSVINSDPNILDYTEYVGGTSASCPIAAGVAALVLSVEPNLTDDEVRYFLERSAKDLGAPGRDDYYGWGRLDARASLDMVLAKRADLNNDRKVDFRDFAVLAACWKTDDLRGDICPIPRPDGAVDVQDLALMGEYWLKKIPDPGQAWGPTPADGATNQLKSILRWNAGETATAHDVYFGSDETAVTNATTASDEYIEQTNQLYSAAVTGLQKEATTYYWRIDEVEDETSTIKGDIWHFTTAPLKAHTPVPADGTLNVDPNLTLTWGAGFNVKTTSGHRVYFGTDATDVANATTSTAGIYKGAKSSASYTTGILSYDTNYYWRIDEVNKDATVTKGDVWMFKTILIITITDRNLIGWWKLDEGQGTMG
jgi:subtilisin family serine protease